MDTVSCRQTLAYEKEFRTGEISYEMQNGLFDSFNPEVVQDYFANGEPFASLDPSYMTVGLLRQCAALGIKTVTLPIPNELGGVTAEIGSYAMGNRNTKHPAEVKALLAYLLSEECQSSSAFADKDMFPVRRGCFKKCMEAQYQFSVYDASHEKIGQEDIENRKEMYGDNLTDLDLCFLFATAAASTHAPPISGSDEYRMVGFSEGAIDNDGFPTLDDFTLLVRSEKN